jgi:hypothetical protein
MDGCVISFSFLSVCMDRYSRSGNERWAKEVMFMFI